MDAINMIKERRSVRKYKDELVIRADIETIMEATKFAPSWSNTQTARYTVIQNPETIAAICEHGVNGFVYNVNTLKEAKNVMILSSITGRSGKFRGDDNYVTTKGNAWEVFDAGIACQTFCLAAHANGIGTCIMGVFDEDYIAKAANLPEGETAAALITFGYPDEEPSPTPRKEVDKLLRFAE